jgi:hypothetical protein
MRTILIVNDNSSEARHAAEFALVIAQRMEADILLVNTTVINQMVTEKVLAGDVSKADIDEHPFPGILHHLNTLNEGQLSFKPAIKEFDVAVMTESEMIELVIKNRIWMMVKGMADIRTIADAKKNLNIHTVLNRVLCPLLLIPPHWELKDLERLVYIADLRYCRIQVVRYLADIAKSWNADLSIAHMSARGLPDMAENYALSVFSEEFSTKVNYDQLFFNNIKEKDLAKAVDVMINAMHNDVLVFVNHRYHFEEILGRYITDSLPLNITIPLLIFPY